MRNGGVAVDKMWLVSMIHARMLSKKDLPQVYKSRGTVGSPFYRTALDDP